MPEREWGEAQAVAEAQLGHMSDQERDQYRVRLRMLPLALRKAWREQDGRGMAIGSADDLAFLSVVQPALEEVPPHVSFQLEMCRALVADLVSNEEQV